MSCRCGRGAASGLASRGLRSGLTGGVDVLVDVEGVAGVVVVFDPGEPVVVAEVGGFDPVLALVHHEVDVGAAGRGGVQILPIVVDPFGDEPGVGGVGVDARDDACPAAVAVGEGGRVGGDAARGAG